MELGDFLEFIWYALVTFWNGIDWESVIVFSIASLQMTLIFIVAPCFAVAYIMERGKKHKSKVPSKQFSPAKATFYLFAGLFCFIVPWVLPMVIRLAIGIGKVVFFLLAMLGLI